MGVSVERLRIGLLVGALLLLAVIGSFLEYAHLRARRFLKDLPGRMGVEFRQETNGYTFSQTLQGRTVFTLHAAKALQRKDGKVTLRDVGIVLYDRMAGREEGRSDAGLGEGHVADRIYGKEFEYEQATGVVRAMGEVHIDLNAAVPAGSAAKMDFAEGREMAATGTGKDDGVVHVQTSGLVFLQKLGVASTDQPIEFAFRGMTGKAKGADYNSDTGLLVLQSDVSVRGERGGRPEVLLASHAVVDRLANTVKLTSARYAVAAVQGAGEETARADEAVFHGAGGSTAGGMGRMPERIEARGSVVLTEGDASIRGERGEMQMGAGGVPERAQMSGGVGFQAEEGMRAMHGTAKEGTGVFDGKGHLQRVQMVGDVEAEEKEGSTGGGEMQRRLTAGSLALEMGVQGDGRLWLQRATAEEDARLEVASTGAAVAGKAAGPDRGTVTDVMRGDQLRAELRLVRGAGQLTRVEGTGHTELRRVGSTGVETSSGAGLTVMFAEVGGKTGRVGVASAVQRGAVVLTKMGTGKADVPQRASADRAVYDEPADQVTMSGAVRLSEAASVLTAERVVMQQASGDAVATGSVRVSYLQQTGAIRGGADAGDPVHVLAERAEFSRASQMAVFHGGQGGGAMARLWQGGSQVEAPVIALNQKDRTLQAHGGDADGGVVRTVFASEGGDGGKEGGKARRGDVLRVSSRELHYADALRRADFLGGVALQDAEGTMHSEQAVVYLEPAVESGPGSQGKGVGPKAGAGMVLGGAVERIVASGGVTLEEPTRRGRGERLVYTASDGVFVLTGTTEAKPEILDQTQGTVVGESLRFDTRDNRVVISGDASGLAGHRVRTETRVLKQR